VRNILARGYDYWAKTTEKEPDRKRVAEGKLP